MTHRGARENDLINLRHRHVAQQHAVFDHVEQRRKRRLDRLVAVFGKHFFFRAVIQLDLRDLSSCVVSPNHFQVATELLLSRLLRHDLKQGSETISFETLHARIESRAEDIRFNHSAVRYTDHWGCMDLAHRVHADRGSFCIDAKKQLVTRT